MVLTSEELILASTGGRRTPIYELTAAEMSPIRYVLPAPPDRRPTPVPALDNDVTDQTIRQSRRSPFADMHLGIAKSELTEPLHDD